MQHPSALDALQTSLERTDEHSMVRHEAAEALGSLEFPTEGSGDAQESPPEHAGIESSNQQARCLALLRRHCLAEHEPGVFDIHSICLA